MSVKQPRHNHGEDEKDSAVNHVDEQEDSQDMTSSVKRKVDKVALHPTLNNDEDEEDSAVTDVLEHERSQDMTSCAKKRRTDKGDWQDNLQEMAEELHLAVDQAKDDDGADCDADMIDASTSKALYSSPCGSVAVNRAKPDEVQPVQHPAVRSGDDDDTVAQQDMECDHNEVPYSLKSTTADKAVEVEPVEPAVSTDDDDDPEYLADDPEDLYCDPDLPDALVTAFKYKYQFKSLPGLVTGLMEAPYKKVMGAPYNKVATVQYDPDKNQYQIQKGTILVLRLYKPRLEISIYFTRADRRYKDIRILRRGDAHSPHQMAPFTVFPRDRDCRIRPDGHIERTVRTGDRDRGLFIKPIILPEDCVAQATSGVRNSDDANDWLLNVEITGRYGYPLHKTAIRVVDVLKPITSDKEPGIFQFGRC